MLEFLPNIRGHKMLTVSEMTYPQIMAGNRSTVFEPYPKVQLVKHFLW